LRHGLLVRPAAGYGINAVIKEQVGAMNRKQRGASRKTGPDPSPAAGKP